MVGRVRDSNAALIRVLLVDDQPLARAGLRTILCADEGCEVVGECADGVEVLGAVRRHAPDVVVMDVRMPLVNGADATRELRAREPGAPPVLILTTFQDDEVLSAALRAGAAGFLLKDAPPDDIVEAVRVVHSGDGLLSPTVTRRVIAAYGAGADRTGPPPPGFDELTDREREVFELFARGRTNREIAAELFVSEATVKTHVGRVLLKLGLRDRVQLVIAAYEMGLVKPGEA